MSNGINVYAEQKNDDGTLFGRWEASLRQDEPFALAVLDVNEWHRAYIDGQWEDVKVMLLSGLDKNDPNKGKINPKGIVRKRDVNSLQPTAVPIPANFAGLEAVMVPTRLDDQFFRIVEVIEDEDCVTVTARHVWYDNLENYTTWKPSSSSTYTGAAACRNILTNTLSPCSSRVASDCTDTLSGKKLDFERKNLVEAFLDPENGLCKKYGLSLIRNNWDFYCLKEVGYDRGIIIQDGKNLLGVERKESIENLATRIAPIGKDEKGKIVWLNYNGKKYIDSSHISEYSYPRVEIYDTGLQIGKNGVTSNNINTKLREAAQKHFTDDKVDIPEVEMTIEFISLGDTEEYKQYRDLDKVYLYDILTVVDKKRGYSYTAQVRGVEHDVLTGQLLSVTIGELKSWNGTRKVATWQVPEVDGGNIRVETIMEGSFAEGAIQSDDIGENVILYAHIADATIDELTSDAITAVTAQIQEIIAGKITADSINTDSIDAINATLGTASIADAQIAQADIDYAQIKDLSAGTAIIEQSITEQGTANHLFINRLMVTYGQMVQATIGDLVIGATNGNYYHVDVEWNDDGVPTLVPREVTVTPEEIEAGHTEDGQTIIGDIGTYAELSSTDFYAINGIIDRITARRIDVDQLFARQAFITQLNTANIANNQYIEIAVRQQLGLGRVYDQIEEPENPEIGDTWYKLTDASGDTPTTWEDFEETTWEELESRKWEELDNTVVSTFVYTDAGWTPIDGYASARIEMTNNRISQIVDDSQGQISDITIQPEGIDMSGSTYIRMSSGGATSMELSADGIDMKTAGKAFIHAKDATGSAIIFGTDVNDANFAVDITGDMYVKSVTTEKLTLGGSEVPTIIVDANQPSGHNILWIKPSSATGKQWAYYPTHNKIDNTGGTLGYYRDYSVPYASTDYLSGQLYYGIRARLYVYDSGAQSYNPLIHLKARLKNGNSWIDLGSASKRFTTAGYLLLDVDLSSLNANVMDVQGGSFTVRIETDYSPTYCRVASENIVLRARSTSSQGVSACDMFYID